MSRPVVVVVSRPGTAADSLREALEQAGAQLAWIGEPEQLDPERPGGDVVVVNLDPAIEPDLARLAPLWSSEAVRVVFNDATVTEGLSGWDLTRWARHLVAKVFALGGHPELPERPADAEPLPVAAIAVDDSPSGSEGAPLRLRVPGRRYVEDEISEEMGAPPLPYDAADEVMPAAAPPSGASRRETDPIPASAATSDSSTELAHAAAEEPIAEVAGEPRDARAASGELVFTDDLDLIAGGGGASDLPPIAIDPEADLDIAAPAQEDELEKLLRQAADQRERPPSPAPPAAATTARGPAPAGTTLRLAEEGEAPSPSPAAGGEKKGVDWSRFRIDQLSLAPLEEDAPRAEQATPPHREGSREAKAESGAGASAGAGVAAGNTQERIADAGASPAQQLWLLVGSFGAPEAIAQFLGQLRTPRRAALLIAVSGGDGPAALASMLAKRTSRQVPVLGARAAPLRAGEVWIVSDGLALGSSTRAELRPERAAVGSGWLDRLLRDAVGLFASDCGVIVFSGESREGFDGTLAVAQRGGAVWAQDPATCIAPDLPELVRSRGLAIFVGSPRAMAEHFNQEIG